MQDEGQLRVDGGALAVRWNVFSFSVSRSVSQHSELGKIWCCWGRIDDCEVRGASGLLERKRGCDWVARMVAVVRRGGGGKAAAARWTVGFGLIPGVCVCVCVCVWLEQGEGRGGFSGELSLTLIPSVRTMYSIVVDGGSGGVLLDFTGFY